MRLVKRFIVVFLIGILFVVPLGCSSEPDSEGDSNTMTMTVERGDMLIEVTSVGNL